MTKFENGWGIHTGEGLARKYPKPFGRRVDVVGVGLFTKHVVEG
jgi:hypothetical protein